MLQHASFKLYGGISMWASGRRCQVELNAQLFELRPRERLRECIRWHFGGRAVLKLDVTSFPRVLETVIFNIDCLLATGRLAVLHSLYHWHVVDVDRHCRCTFSTDDLGEQAFAPECFFDDGY